MNLPAIPAADAAVIRYFIGPFDLIIVDGTEHTWVSTDRNGHVLALRSEPGRHVSFDHDFYRNLVNSGRANRKRDYFAEGEARARNVVKWAPLSTLPDHKARKTITFSDALDIFIQMREAANRGERVDGRKVNTGDKALAWILPEIERELMERQKALAGRGGKQMPIVTLTCSRDFRRKLKKYLEAGCNKRILDDRSGGKSRRNTVVDIAEYQVRREHQLRYASKNRPSVAAVRLDYYASIHEVNQKRVTEGQAPVRPVSRKTFDKGIKQLDLFHVALGRGEEADAHKLMNINNHGVDVEYPLERVEMDEWKVDLMVLLIDLGIWERMTESERKLVERTRLWATVAIDVATRCILAMKLFSKAPSHESAVATLEMAMMDKTLISEVVGAGSPWVYHGLISEVYMDAGSAFLSHECRMALIDSGVSHVYPVTGVPQMRPYIERVFRTCSERFLVWFSGRTFSDYVTKGEYDSEANASLCVQEFSRVFLRALIDIYHHTPHEGLAGETPHNAWMRLSCEHGVEQPPSPEERRHFFGLHCSAHIGDYGIRFLGLQYQSRDLQMIRKAVGNVKIRFRVDRFDLSAISAWDGTRWFHVPTRFAFPDNVSIWEWTASCAQLRRVHAGNAKLGLSIMLEAVNDIRKSGEAAMERAELGTPVVNADYVKRQEEKLFRGLEIVDDRKEPVRLLDLTVRRAIPSEDATAPAISAIVSAPGPRYRDRYDFESDVDPDPASVELPKGQYGGADDVEFED